MREAVRIEPDEKKEDPLDFALWKKSKENEPGWESPWGKGRPGWHIECSVMSSKYLKTETLDIHGGGRDLIFPHHENEIAQAEALTGKPFAKYWIHHGLLTINGQKMAKSLGNFVTVEKILEKYPADILKLLFLEAHYASPVDFSWAKCEEVKKAYEKFMILLKKIEGVKPSVRTGDKSPGLKASRLKFTEAMDDDFNTAKALAEIYNLLNLINKNLDSADKGFLPAAKGCLLELSSVLGLSLEVSKGELDTEIQALIDKRQDLRNKRQFKEADEIRKNLEDKGIILEDTKEGITWRRKI
jgi:cysteinyl-tRNA synthetase